MPSATAILLRTTYDGIHAKSQLFDRFYELLVARCPETRALFPASMKAQRESLAAMIAAVVLNAEQFGAFEPMIRELGERHLSKGTREEHYPIFTSVLLKCLAEALGDRWTPEVKQAWSSTLANVGNIMIRGARLAAAPGEAPRG